MIEKIMLTCQEVAYLASKELDTRLPFIKRVQMRMHLAMCSSCFRYRKQLKTIQALIRKVLPGYHTLSKDSSEGLSEQSRNRIKAYLQNSQK